MNYISTRGQSPAVGFEEALLTGLAPDGGLYVPQTLPSVSTEQIEQWAGLDYPALAFEVIRPFINGEIEDDDLRDIIARSYSTFAHPAVAPLRLIDHNHWVMELYCGPTLAFKDFALQLLGNLLEHVLERRDQKMVVMGATSGDTGSAALEGCKHCRHLDLVILHPYQRVSEVQRRQMTTVEGDNVHNIAVRGNFDDCQRLVKTAFSDQSFLPEGRQLVAVNSINWARIMAQIVYYFHAGLSVGAPARPVSFTVPTGNFGDIYAGYLARQMGLPVRQLVIATNRNDILHRLISRNEYALNELQHSLSPSMDIMVSSNFERYLFDLFGRDAGRTREFVTGLGTRPLHLDESEWQAARRLFSSHSVDDDTTCEVIRRVFEQTEFLVDPHTAVGIQSAEACNEDRSVPMVTLSTAHPVKFADAVSRAGLDSPALPPHMSDLMDRPERYEVLDNDIDTVTRYMRDTL